jgi:hypothetical protein
LFVDLCKASVELAADTLLIYQQMNKPHRQIPSPDMQMNLTNIHMDQSLASINHKTRENTKAGTTFALDCQPNPAEPHPRGIEQVFRYIDREQANE